MRYKWLTLLMVVSLWFSMWLTFQAGKVSAQAPAPATPAVEPVPAPVPAPARELPLLPWWAYLIAIPGLNAGLYGLQKVAPKIPAVWVPFISTGVGAVISVFGLGLPHDTIGAVAGNTAVITGASTVIHNVVKNGVRGDKFGQGSQLQPLSG